FVGLIWLLDGCRTRLASFGVGWWFGFGHFTSGLYWIALALLTEPERFAWMVPFAVFGISALLAAFTGLATLATYLVGRAGFGRILVFAVAWGVAEWLRGHVLTGFAWNLLATVWTVSTPMMQVTAVIGAYGLSLVTAACAAAPATLADRYDGRRWRPLAAAVAVLALLWAGGAARLALATTDFVPGVRLRIVQPNIRQHHKWRADLRRRHMVRHLRLSRAPQARPISHIIWPETAMPYDLATAHALRRVLAAAAPPGGLLITGAPRFVRRPGRAPRAWNSIQAIDRAATIVGTYDKHHLVPFGEYVPFRRYLKFSKITSGTADFTPGPGPRTLTLPGLPPVSPLICYEAIFPGHVSDPAHRPEWLLNVTNDAWFGTSSGPYQHFAAARLRAVEEGLPLVRAANTGISAVVDAHGRVLARLGLNRAGVVDAPLPKPVPVRTIYSRFGDYTFLLLIVVVGLWVFLYRRQNHK
ncbi:MAG: apolipoprotein N-acyltransferase, partial [Alphaproteobacteria bacterium]